MPVGPITAAFVEAICHHTMDTPAHIRSRLAPNRDDKGCDRD